MPGRRTVRSYCLKQRLQFTTAYHTQFPEYVRARVPIPVALTTRLIRWFHRPATRTMVPTESMRRILEERGFENVVLWTRRVQTDVFNADDPVSYELPKPIWVYTGRVAVEKNIEAFLNLELPGSKVIIGDGPDRQRLTAKYPDCCFLGYKFGRDLARHIAGADVFVFPSKTDTFGIVMLEAMACGLPIAAFPVTGPVDVAQLAKFDLAVRPAPCCAGFRKDRRSSVGPAHRASQAIRSICRFWRAACRVLISKPDRNTNPVLYFCG